MRPILEWVAMKEAEETTKETLKSVTGTMQTAKDQFTGLVSPPAQYQALQY
jgi:hypothetical protein